MNIKNITEDFDIISDWCQSFYEDDEKDYENKKYFNFKVPCFFEALANLGCQNIADRLILQNMTDVAIFLKRLKLYLIHFVA